MIGSHLWDAQVDAGKESTVNGGPAGVQAVGMPCPEDLRRFYVMTESTGDIMILDYRSPDPDVEDHVPHEPGLPGIIVCARSEKALANRVRGCGDLDE
jgi:hypothetical protein